MEDFSLKEGEFDLKIDEMLKIYFIIDFCPQRDTLFFCLFDAWIFSLNFIAPPCVLDHVCRIWAFTCLILVGCIFQHHLKVYFFLSWRILNSQYIDDLSSNAH